MPLSPATYEIVGPLGAGGMGEVFKVSDTRLNRIVAIKRLKGHPTCIALCPAGPVLPDPNPDQNRPDRILAEKGLIWRKIGYEIASLGRRCCGDGVRVRFPLRHTGLARTNFTNPNFTRPDFTRPCCARFKRLRELSSERLGHVPPHRHGSLILSPGA